MNTACVEIMYKQGIVVAVSYNVPVNDKAGERMFDSALCYQLPIMTMKLGNFCSFSGESSSLP